ncbi:MAG: type II toxin-antitoxin system death-on-curing family toxin [Robiginitomaculum sp.]|nr:type II toxin-antitoxin system death-on-curing family toxin [Robiginitomaculum sp.]
MTKHYLGVDDVLAFHDDQLRRYGGAAGVRDMGQLQAALFRPQTGYYLDLIQEASALWESLSQNHPFVDGNKRTAFAVTDTFLLINGLEITATAVDTWEFLINLYETREMNFDRLEVWLRDNTAPV